MKSNSEAKSILMSKQTLNSLKGDEKMNVEEEKCKECNGSGQIGYAVDFSDYAECPSCEGFGVEWKKKEESQQLHEINKRKDKIIKWEKEYDRYLKEFESSTYMDVDAHTKWSLRIGALIDHIKALEECIRTLEDE